MQVISSHEHYHERRYVAECKSSACNLQVYLANGFDIPFVVAVFSGSSDITFYLSLFGCYNAVLLLRSDFNYFVVANISKISLHMHQISFACFLYIQTAHGYLDKEEMSTIFSQVSWLWTYSVTTRLHDANALDMYDYTFH